MKKICFALIFFFSVVSSLGAMGVEAGTVIINQATLSYELEEKQYEINSNQTKDVVEQLIDVRAHPLDEKLVAQSGESGVFYSFKVTNTGNGEDHFKLHAQGADDTDVRLLNKLIYLDTNHNSQLDSDDLHHSEVSLVADESMVVYVRADVPKIDMVRDMFAKIIFTAKSKRGGSGKRGTIHEGKGVLGLDAMDGLNGGIAKEKAVMTISDPMKPTILKNIEVQNKYGTNEPITDAILTITMEVVLPHEGKVDDFRLSDKIPTYTDYVQNSLVVNGLPVSDKSDKDSGMFDHKNGAIVVSLKALSYPQVLTVSYRVKLQ